MNETFKVAIAASDQERRDLFLATSARLGTAVQNVEKDFWVCWTLDALFNGLPADGPRLLFKGGTSLSKAFGLIPRFSEDIDVTVFRDDLGQPADATELEALSGKKRRARLDAIRAACQAYIAGPLLEQLGRLAGSVIPSNRFRLELDADDNDRQTILFRYPAVTARSHDDYIRSAVKIELGAKSALDPHVAAMVVPYVAHELPDMDMSVSGVTTVKPERTFWDKVVILPVCASGTTVAVNCGTAGNVSHATTTMCTSCCRRAKQPSGGPTTRSRSIARVMHACFSVARTLVWTPPRPVLSR